MHPQVVMRPLPAPELVDEVVRLRTLRPADAASMAAATGSGPYVPWGHVTGPIDEARAAAFVEEWEEGRRQGRKLAFLVLAPDGEEILGSAMLQVSGPAEAELAYWTRPEARGHGYATRALQLLSGWAEAHGFVRLWLEVEPGNQASLAVGRHAGFGSEERRVCDVGGTPTECVILYREQFTRRTHTGLPPGCVLAHPALEDLEEVVELLNACELADCGERETSQEWLLADWQGLPRFDLSRDAWIVRSIEGTIIGYAWAWDERPHTQAVADQNVLPAFRGLGIEERLMQLIEARAAEHAAAAPARACEVGVFACSTSTAKIALLQRRGFAYSRLYSYMRTDLARSLPAPAFPPGVMVRTFRPGIDDAAVHAHSEEAFAEHFRYAPLSLAEWRRLLYANPVMDPELFWVAWDGDEAVGVVRALPHPGADHAWIEELAVHPRRRGRGLGLALLLHAFRALRGRGYRYADLDVDTQNATDAQGLYHRAGMKVERSIEFYEKRIEP